MKKYIIASVILNIISGVLIYLTIKGVLPKITLTYLYETFQIGYLIICGFLIYYITKYIIQNQKIKKYETIPCKKLNPILFCTFKKMLKIVFIWVSFIAPSFFILNYIIN